VLSFRLLIPLLFARQRDGGGSRSRTVCRYLNQRFERSDRPCVDKLYLRHLLHRLEVDVMDLHIAFRRSLRAAFVHRRPRRGLLHTSNFRSANPIPFPTIVEPPPSPPEPERIQPDDNRKRRQAELLRKGRDVGSNPSRPATVLQKRFWRDVSVEETPGKLFGESNLGDPDVD